MASKRRMGPESSETRAALMDAVEAVMREQGYAALSARSVAARAGLKYQIVFYYFETMDDLLLAAYRRNTEAMWARLEQGFASSRPLHAFWQAWSNPDDAAIALEFMALANHNAVIRAEKIAFSEQVRRALADQLAERMRTATPNPEVFTPYAISMALASIGGILGFEDALGIPGGHAETRALVAWCLDQLEPSEAPAAPAPALT